MPECDACGSQDVAWRESKGGGFYLVDTKRPHFCPKRAKKESKNGQKPAKKAKRAPAPDSPAEEMLREMGYKREGEAADMLKDIPEAAPEAMVLAAITKMGEG